MSNSNQAPIVIVNRSELVPDYDYSVESESASGNWSTVMRTNEIEMAQSCAEYYKSFRQTVRVVSERE